ncbi:MAG: DNA gyrase/topoisomerase IV subunit A, partial [Prevotella sp.]|nr:DNA gyrase/topoisomerase IV subunit A [Prevotella sp.]
MPADEADADVSEEHSDYVPVGRFDASAVHHLSGMYESWFLDYASYVILERAVPHIDDGLKPVQRRILHSMKRMDDGRYNKVANIVGHTMQFHPHGDASIGDALVGLGQKELLIDTQGNWGNIFTGDRAAAPRYIEARLTKFALEAVFNPKTTDWQLSYDGRNREPVTLPVKFPLLLAQGAEGIAVGLSSKILPHNFIEICDAAMSYLRGEEFVLYPDFPTGGSIDVSRYNDGQRGGLLRVRARIEKADNRTLVIRQIPYSKTTSTLPETIVKAIDRGKIKAKRVVDNTASEVEIVIQLQPGISPDKTIDALYAFTDCEINISPNCCVISGDKPCFLSVSDVLRHTTDRTKALLRRELEIRLSELSEELFFLSLEKIFIEERIYKEEGFEQAATLEQAVKFVDLKLAPFKPQLLREVTRDDILRLLEIKMERILKFSKKKADGQIARLNKDIKSVERDLKEMTRVAIEWFAYLKEKYGAGRERKTEIRSFDAIRAERVAEANEKLYINRAEGFIGTGLKKDEFVCNCSDIDEIIVFFDDGRYKVVRVADKIFIGRGVKHVQVYRRGETRTIYNVIYRDGAHGNYYAKRFNVPAVSREKEYNLTQGKAGSRVVYFSHNPNGEAETVRITLTAGKNTKKTVVDYDFSRLQVKGRGARGNLIAKRTIRSVVLKSSGRSTLGGRSVWFDGDIRRINYDGNGLPLGEFGDGDSILVVLRSGEFYFSDINTANHYEDDILRIEKADGAKTWTLVYSAGGDESATYIKRFTLEPSKKRRTMLNDNADARMLLLTDTSYPRVRLTFAGEKKEPLTIDAEEFVG